MSSTNHRQNYTLSYPARAHPPISVKNPIIAEQPAPAQRMSIYNPQQQGRAERLRGGCIPCPNGGCCFIIPLPCC